MLRDWSKSRGEAEDEYMAYEERPRQLALSSFVRRR